MGPAKPRRRCEILEPAAHRRLGRALRPACSSVVLDAEPALEQILVAVLSAM